MKKLSIAVVVALAFIAGYLLPKQNMLEKGQAYKAGDYVVYYRTYKGRGGMVYQKIDINGKRDLKGGIYKKGATIEESR